MDNEYYFLSELEKKMDDFLERENQSGEFGYVAPYTAKRMAEVAFAVLRNAKELQDMLITEGELKP